MVSTGFVALGFTIALLIVFVGIAQKLSKQAQHSADRREVMRGIVTLGTAAYVAGALGPFAMDAFGSAGSESSCLIESGTVLRIEDGETETCGTVTWEDTGTLRMDTGATLEVTG